MAFDPSRAQITCTKLADFLEAKLEADLQSIPGVTTVAVEKLAAAGIAATHQLIGKFLMLRDPDFGTKEHCDAFYSFLAELGINSHRGCIVLCIAEKVNCMIPGVYDPSVYA